MDVKFHGANCISIQTKKNNIVIDDNLKSYGKKPITKDSDITIYTSRVDEKEVAKSLFYVDRPGEYEVANVSIQGISAQAHVDEPGAKNAVIYRIVINDYKVGIIGHIYPELSDEQLEALGMIDILFVPVGGNGFTLDSIGALKVIKKVGPSIVIPTHYADSKIKFEVPQASLDEVRKNLSMEPAEELDELKLKSREFAEGTKLVILKAQ